MQFQNDPFAGLQQFGGGPMSMGGPSGFAGDMPGGGMFGAPMQQKKKNGGFNPAFLMGLIPGLLAQHPGYALPSLFGAAGIAGHALKLF